MIINIINNVIIRVFTQDLLNSSKSSRKLKILKKINNNNNIIIISRFFNNNIEFLISDEIYLYEMLIINLLIYFNRVERSHDATI